MSSAAPPARLRHACVMVRALCRRQKRGSGWDGRRGDGAVNRQRADAARAHGWGPAPLASPSPSLPLSPHTLTRKKAGRAHHDDGQQPAHRDGQVRDVDERLGRGWAAGRRGRHLGGERAAREGWGGACPPLPAKGERPAPKRREKKRLCPHKTKKRSRKKKKKRPCLLTTSSLLSTTPPHRTRCPRCPAPAPAPPPRAPEWRRPGRGRIE